MSRTIKWTFGIAMGLLVVGLPLIVVAPGWGGEVAVIVALILLACLTVAANAMSRRSRGWTRVVNPGAARREYQAEVAARKHAAEPAPGQAPDARPVPGPTAGGERED